MKPLVYVAFTYMAFKGHYPTHAMEPLAFTAFAHVVLKICYLHLGNEAAGRSSTLSPLK